MHAVPFHRAVAAAVSAAAAVAFAGAAYASVPEEAAAPVARSEAEQPFIGPRAPVAGAVFLR